MKDTVKLPSTAWWTLLVKLGVFIPHLHWQKIMLAQHSTIRHNLFHWYTQMSSHVVLCNAMLCCAMPYCAALCCAMPCCAVSCCAVSCCAVPYCADPPCRCELTHTVRQNTTLFFGSVIKSKPKWAVLVLRSLHLGS